MPDITLEGHELSPIYGSGTTRWAVCSCDEPFHGATVEHVVDFHRQHCERIHDALVAPLRKDAARRGLGRAREALAETVQRKGGAA